MDDKWNHASKRFTRIGMRSLCQHNFGHMYCAGIANASIKVCFCESIPELDQRATILAHIISSGC